MSNAYRHVELLTGDIRRRRWTTEQKLTIIEQSFEPGETVSSTARRHGVAPNLLYRWRRLLSEGGAAAVDSDEPVAGNSEVKKLEDRVRELERMRSSSAVLIIARLVMAPRWQKTPQRASREDCLVVEAVDDPAHRGPGSKFCGKTVKLPGGPDLRPIVRKFDQAANLQTQAACRTSREFSDVSKRQICPLPLPHNRAEVDAPQAR